jgi:hypothetical protein
MIASPVIRTLRRAAWVSGLATLLTLGATASARAAPRPLVTGVMDPFTFPQPRDRSLAFDRVKAAGATVVRITVSWKQVAPAAPPRNFDPGNPAERHYNWSSVDSEIRAAAAHGLDPIVDIVDAPSWVQPPHNYRTGPGPYKPVPAQVAKFGQAAARRYAGGFRGLPRVHYWQLLNEPNINLYLTPQFEGRRPAAPALYRVLLNAFADAVHGVHADNVVIAGGLSPFAHTDNGFTAMAPLLFMRQLLCLSAGSTPRPTCDAKVKFDVWAHHPYTIGGPTDHAHLPDDVSLGDLQKMQRLLDAAAAAGHIVSRGPVRFWVTEFSWNTNPPARHAVPVALHARWTAEALYRMWNSGISLVVWFLLRDDPTVGSPYKSGLYADSSTSLANDRPKLSLSAFRFPFVAYSQYPRREAVSYWGRTPAGTPARVVVEQRTPGGWHRIALIRTDRYGIFTGSAPTPFVGSVRARVLDRPVVSVPFSLTVPPDHPYAPFAS